MIYKAIFVDLQPELSDSVKSLLPTCDFTTAIVHDIPHAIGLAYLGSYDIIIITLADDDETNERTLSELPKGMPIIALVPEPRQLDGKCGNIVYSRANDRCLSRTVKHVIMSHGIHATLNDIKAEVASLQKTILLAG